MSDDKNTDVKPFVDPNSGAAPQPGGIVSPGATAGVENPEEVAKASAEGASKMAEELAEAKADATVPNDEAPASDEAPAKKTTASKK